MYEWENMRYSIDSESISMEKYGEILQSNDADVTFFEPLDLKSDECELLNLNDWRITGAGFYPNYYAC
jgi:hypothetical protein